MALGNKIAIALALAFCAGLYLAGAGHWWGALLCVPGALALGVYLNLEAILDRIADTLKGIRLW